MNKLTLSVKTMNKLTLSVKTMNKLTLSVKTMNKLTLSMKTMNKLKKSISVNDIEVIDTSLIYSRVIALQLTNDAMKVENVSKYEHPFLRIQEI